MRFVFLDIDGVVAPFTATKDYRYVCKDMLPPNGCLMFDPHCVAELNHLCMAVNASIIVSSSWRHYIKELEVMASELDKLDIAETGKVSDGIYIITDSRTEYYSFKQIEIISDTEKTALINKMKNYGEKSYLVLNNKYILRKDYINSDTLKDGETIRVRLIGVDTPEYNPSKSVQSALNLAVLNLSGQTISGKVPTQVSKDMILQETALLDKLRNELGISNLIFEIEVDKSLFPDFEDNKPVQAMTQREKYLLMLEKNPSLGSFTKKFGLKLDTEV